MNLTFIAFIVCAVAYLFLSVVLLIGWKGKKEGGILLLVSILSLAWSISGIFVAVSSGKLVAISLIVEGLRNAAIIAFLLILLKKVTSVVIDGEHVKPSSYYCWMLAVSVLVVIYNIAIDIITGFTPLISSVTPSMSGHLAISVLVLALLEQLYRNTASEKRWGIKYISLAFAGIFVYEFYLYADSLLFNRIEAGLWGARPWIVAVVSPFIAVSAARNPKWSLDVYVSRQAVFHTATLIGAGVYLLLMSIAGFYIKKYGGDWGTVAQAVFVFAAIMVLLLIMLSGKTRSWLRVTVNKHFFNYKYDYREEWIRFNKTLTALDDILPIRSRAIKSLAQIVESPAGLFFKKEQDGDYQLAANWNTALPEIDIIHRDDPLALFVKEKEWVIDLQDKVGANKEGSQENKPVIAEPLKNGDYRFLIPLLNDSEIYGFIILNEPRSSLNLNWEDIDILKTAGSQVASYLAQYDANDQLTIARQFEAYNRLSTFVIHDLKNLVGQLTLLSANSKKFRHNEEFIDDAFETVENSVDKMNHLLEQLRSGIEKKVVGRVNIGELIGTVVQLRKGAGASIEYDGSNSSADSYYVSADKQELAAVVEHILQNALDATLSMKDKAVVKIAIIPRDKFVIVRIEDNGEGMSREFIRDRLFSPFDTTKGDSGMGVGVYQAREYITRIGGRIEVNSEVGVGTEFNLYLPFTVTSEK